MPAIPIQLSRQSYATSLPNFLKSEFPTWERVEWWTTWRSWRLCQLYPGSCQVPIELLSGHDTLPDRFWVSICNLNHSWAWSSSTFSQPSQQLFVVLNDLLYCFLKLNYFSNVKINHDKWMYTSITKTRIHLY